MNLRLPPFWPDSARNEGLMNYEHIDTRLFVALIPASGSAAGVIVLRSNVGPALTNPTWIVNAPSRPCMAKPGIALSRTANARPRESP